LRSLVPTVTCVKAAMTFSPRWLLQPTPLAVSARKPAGRNG